MSWFGSGIPTEMGWEPQLGGQDSVSIGPGLAHFRLIILTQRVIRISKDRFVSPLLLNQLCQELTEFIQLTEHTECSFIMISFHSEIT